MPRPVGGGANRGFLHVSEWEGQEFLRFAGCRSPEQMNRFLLAFGSSSYDVSLLGVNDYAEVTDPGDVQSTVLFRLTAEQLWEAARQRGHPAPVNPVDAIVYAGVPDSQVIDDLVRTANLLQAIVDAYRLSNSTDDAAKWRRKVKRGKDLESLPVTGPLLAAGIAVEGEYGVLADRLINPTDPEEDWGFMPPTLALSNAGLRRFVAEQMTPVLSLSPQRLEDGPDGLNLVFGPSPRLSGFIPKLFAQAAVAFAEGRTIRSCQWERCPGPPERPGQFIFRTRLTGAERDGQWTWKDMPQERRNRGQDYCSPECAHAASEAVRRQRGRDAHPGMRKAIQRGRPK